jgi:hypothetical protein
MFSTNMIYVLFLCFLFLCPFFICSFVLYLMVPMFIFFSSSIFFLHLFSFVLLFLLFYDFFYLILSLLFFGVLIYDCFFQFFFFIFVPLSCFLVFWFMIVSWLFLEIWVLYFFLWWSGFEPQTLHIFMRIVHTNWAKLTRTFECYIKYKFVNVIFNVILNISLFILYSIIHVICPKNTTTAICHTVIHYPAILFLGSATTHCYLGMTTMGQTHSYKTDL